MIEDYMKEYGFSTCNISKIKQIINIDSIGINQIKIINNYFEKTGLSKKKIINLIVDNPKIYKYDIKDIEDKIKLITYLVKYKKEALEVLSTNPFLFNYLNTSILEVYYYFLSLGFSKKQILENIPFWQNSLDNNKSLDDNKKEIEERKNYLEKIGFKRKIIDKLVEQSPNILFDFEKRLEHFISLGYTEKQVVKIHSYYTNLRGLKIKTVERKIKDLLELGFTHNEVIKMTVSLPQLLSYNIETIKNKLLFFNNLGFSSLEIKKIILTNTDILSYTIESICNKIKNLIELGYKMEEIKYIIYDFPGILNANIDSIKEKILYLKEINLDKVILEKPKHLIQGLDLIYARYNHLNDNGIVVNMNNYNLLFQGKNIYKKMFNISSEELIKLYSYKEYKNKNILLNS